MAFKKFIQASVRHYSQEVCLNPQFKFACCDCGLVHDMQIRIMLKVRRNKRATQARRKTQRGQ